MSDTCQGVTSRSSIQSREPDEARACEPPKEDPEAARARADREAEARREAWSHGEGERGMTSRHATSRLSPTPPECPGPTAQERAAAATAKMDKPLEHDILGNMIPSLFAGGILAGVEAGAAGLGAGEIAGHVAEHALVDAQADLLTHGATHVGTAPATAAGRGEAAQAHAPAAGPSHASVGRTSPRAAASEIAPEPNQSTIEREPAPMGRDRAPYAPGHAPVKIPEAPMMIRG